MKSRVLLTIAAVALVFAVPSAATAQSLFFGGGVTFPTGEFGAEDMTAADSGWLGIAGITFPIGDGGFWVGAEGFYGQNNHSDGNEKTNPHGAMGILGYDLSSSDGGLYVFGGAGLMVHKFSSDDDPSIDSSDSNFGYQAGAGYGIPLGGALALFLEGRFMGATETTFFGLMAGATIGLGSS